MIDRDALLARRTAPAHVIGAASAEGVAVARLLARMGFEQVVLHDSRARDDLRAAFRTTHGAYSPAEQDELWQQLGPLVDAGRFGDAYLTGIEPGTTVSLGQGWYLDERNRAAIEAAIPDDVLRTSMIELYFLLAPGAVAGVTGTNGKTTTVALADHLLGAAGVAHNTAGNERSSRQFLPEILNQQRGTLTLLEVSNRQLLQLDTSPQIAAITSLTPDHLEEHGSFAAYADAKRTLFRHQQPGDVAIVNADSEACLAAADGSPAQLVRCGIGYHEAPSVAWEDGVLRARRVPAGLGGSLVGGDAGLELATRDDLRLPGDHNLRNAAVAVAVALACGAPAASIAEGLRTFEGKSLRLEPVAELDGVTVYSDIKSTTPEATVAALQALAPRHLVVIAGGDDKGLDYAGLAAEVAASGAALLLVPGDASDKLEAALAARGVAPERVEALEPALERALALASPGDAVIVSPAAAGFWTSQLQGGPSLRTLVRRMAGTPSATTTS